MQKCAAYQDLPTLQLWSKSHYPFWNYFPFFIKKFKILILFVLYFKNYKRQMVSWYCKHVQHVKIYLPCNFEVNLITHLGVIVLFFILFYLNFNTFRLIFKKEIDVKFKLQKCSECQDLHTVQFWSKSDNPSWSYCPLFINISKFYYFSSFISKTKRDRC